MCTLRRLRLIPTFCLCLLTAFCTMVGCSSSGGGGGGGSDDNVSDNENENLTEDTPRDYWQTATGGTTSQDFSETPIPAGFFDHNGRVCEAFTGAASFVGTAFNEGALGQADTIVNRLDDPISPSDPVGTVNSVEIEMSALNMQSVDPITVLCDGEETQWDVLVQLSDTSAPRGTLTATKEYENGGRAESVLFVLPKLVFTNRDDPSIERTLDAGAEGEEPIEFQASIPWVHALDPNNPDPNTTFILGVNGRPGAFKLTRQVEEVDGTACDFITCEEGLTCNGETGECCDPETGACFPPVTGAVEIDRFDFSIGDVALRTPSGATETIEMSGVAEAIVFFEGDVEGAANSDDDDTLDEVSMRMAFLDLRGVSSSVGDISVGLNHDIPSMGEIEEQANSTPGTLDLPPFAETGRANSHFDLYFEFEVGGLLLHTIHPKRMSSVIDHKPPGPGTVYENLEDIQLYDADGNPTGYWLSAASHRPTANLIDCVEHFNPSGSHVHNTCAADTDVDGITDGVDNCRFDDNAGQEDEDDDTFGDACDPCPNDPQCPSGNCETCVGILNEFWEKLLRGFDCDLWEACVEELGNCGEACMEELMNCVTDCTDWEDCIACYDQSDMPSCADFEEQRAAAGGLGEGDAQAFAEEFTGQGCDRCDPRLFDFGSIAWPECFEDPWRGRVIAPLSDSHDGTQSEWEKWIPQRRHRRG